MLALSLLAAAASAQTFSACGTGGIYTVDKTNISPYPLVHGKNVTIFATGTTTGVINQGASIDVSVFKGKIRIYHQTLDLCQQSLLQDPPVTCPVPAGPQTLNVTQLVPSIIPAGQYVMTIATTNADGSAVNCLTSNIQVTGCKESLQSWLMLFSRVFVPITAALAQTFTECSGVQGQTVSIIGASFDPYPIVAGENNTSTFHFTNTVDILSGATYGIHISKGKLEIYKNDPLDFCELAQQSGLQCPIPPGNHVISGPHFWISILPAGNYIVKLNATNGDAAKSFIGCSYTIVTTTTKK
ncbi:Phosphatidylglycerol/phosphatidylinositol transfer protein [Boothiomyces sp. JEL0838]|nr:Phosphatidylglycerol/phosphatidylinositol transfer protein [Boothiomyces sp. JEL0838]